MPRRTATYRNCLRLEPFHFALPSCSVRIFSPTLSPTLSILFASCVRHWSLNSQPTTLNQPPFRLISTNFDQFRPISTEKKIRAPSGQKSPRPSLRLFAAFCAQNLCLPFQNRNLQFQRRVPRWAANSSLVIAPPALDPRHPQGWYFSRRITPRVKMRRLTISNLRREKWYSTILSDTEPLCCSGCAHSATSCSRSRFPSINPQPSTLNQKNLSTIPGSLQVIPGGYHQFQPAVFSASRGIQNQTTLSTIISNSE